MFNKNIFDDDGLDFNFWPAFTDLMLSITLIMCALLIVKFGVKAVDLQNKQESNKAIIAEISNSIKKNYNNIITNETTNSILISDGANAIMKIKYENDYQQISFYENILFEQGNSNLIDKGKSVLIIVGNALKHKSKNITLIQIEGHTDNVPIKNGNLYLGANRAMNVYTFFKDQVGLDPATTLMSATTFGEFMPVDRKEDAPYSAASLEKANDESAKMASNRRIELRVFFSSHKASN